MQTDMTVDFWAFKFYSSIFIVSLFLQYPNTAVGPPHVHSKGALAPMNKFASKLHGYVVYFVIGLVLKAQVVVQPQNVTIQHPI